MKVLNTTACDANEDFKTSRQNTVIHRMPIAVSVLKCVRIFFVLSILYGSISESPGQTVEIEK